jgi:peptide chain release factor 2
MPTLQAEWGRQIRNYVFHPYKMVKDLRSGHETGNTAAVMDGELDPFMQVHLAVFRCCHA